MHLLVDYPTPQEELLIIELIEKNRREQNDCLQPMTTQEEVLQAREAASRVYISDSLKKYIVSLVTATRTPEKYNKDLAKWIEYGASPRATLALVRCAKALAWLKGEEHVTPMHIHQIAPPILRHRIIPTFASEAEGVTRDETMRKLLEVVAIP
jgi:MoxR-like ATPase